MPLRVSQHFSPADHLQGPPYFHRMPIGFGPFSGPRQIPCPGERQPERSRKTIASVTYETEEAALRELLPSCFEPGSVPNVTVEIQQIENLDWLAGRGYSTLGVKFPALFRTGKETIEGSFLAVLWENLPDAVLSGREELGYAKLWCAIEETVRGEDRKKYTASWLGHPFFEMELSGLRESTSPTAASKPLFHYKYIPKTGAPGEADAAYPVISPADNPHLAVDRRMSADKGRFQFRPSTWEELPTLYHIVNALAALPLGRFLSGSLVLTHGGKDLSDQSILLPQ